MVILDLVVKPTLALFFIATILFVTWWVQFDPILLLVDYTASPAEIEAVREAWGLNQPLVVQYGSFLFNLFTLRFLSLRVGGTTLGNLLALRLPNTLVLVIVPFLVVGGFFTVYNLRNRSRASLLSNWERHVDAVVFARAPWILLAAGLTLSGIFEYLTVYVWNSLLPYRTLVPLFIVGLASLAVGVHYFHQSPGEGMPPLSHGLPRLLLWTAAIAWPVEVWFQVDGIISLRQTSGFFLVYAAVPCADLTVVVVFGLPAVILEASLRWGLYRNPVELHGQRAPLAERASLRRPSVLLGLLLVSCLLAITIRGIFLPVPSLPPSSGNIIEYSLRSLFPFLVQTCSESLFATCVGGVLGLAGYYTLRMNASWAVRYVLSLPLSVFVVTLFLQPPLPYIWYTGIGLLLCIGAIRRISNTELGEGRVALHNWLRSLVPLFVHYTLVCGLLVLVTGAIVGPPRGLFYSNLFLNLGEVMNEVMRYRISYPSVVIVPGLLASLFVVAFDLLWCGLRMTLPSKVLSS